MSISSIHNGNPGGGYDKKAISGNNGLSPSFDYILEQEKVKFSNHAQSRIKSDRIDLSQESINKISDGIDRAAMKGAKESLLLLDDSAFIIDVRDRVVITSMNKDRLKENIFTKIDSAIIL